MNVAAGGWRQFFLFLGGAKNRKKITIPEHPLEDVENCERCPDNKKEKKKNNLKFCEYVFIITVVHSIVQIDRGGLGMTRKQPVTTNTGMPILIGLVSFCSVVSFVNTLSHTFLVLC